MKIREYVQNTELIRRYKTQTSPKSVCPGVMQCHLSTQTESLGICEVSQWWWPLTSTSLSLKDPTLHKLWLEDSLLSGPWKGKKKKRNQKKLI